MGDNLENADAITDSSKRDNLTHRMSKLLGLPVSNIQMLMPMIPQEEVDRLSVLPDDQFLSESAKVINAAQQMQYQEQGAGGVISTAPGIDGGVETEAMPEATAASPSLEIPSTGDDGVPPALTLDQPARKRQAKPEGKKNMIVFAAGGVGLLIFLGTAVVFMISLLKDPESPSPDNGGRFVDDEELVDPMTDENDPRHPQWALKVSKQCSLEVDNPQVFVDVTDQFTVEMWLKPLVSTRGMMPIAIAGTGEGESFSLTVEPAAMKRMTVTFKTTGVGKEPARKEIPQTTKWIHLAGVYDADAADRLRLFVDGKLAADGYTRKAFAPPEGYRLTVAQGQEQAASLIDDVRLSSAALYTKDFKTERIFKHEADTISWLLIERRGHRMIVDLAQDGEKYENSCGEWIDIRKHIHKILIKREFVEFPVALLVALEKAYGPDFRDQFIKEWETTSNKKRRDYLVEIGYQPPE